MKKIGEDLERIVSSLGTGDDKAKEAQRIAEVNYIFKETIQAIYGGAAPLVFRYINTVYIMSGAEGSNVRRFDRPRSEFNKQVEGKVLVIYSNDSTIRSDLDARQEFIKIKMRDKGENIEAVKIIPSTFEMKDRHPFITESISSGRCEESTQQQSFTIQPLTSKEREVIESSVSPIENNEVRRALKQAMTSDLQRKNALNARKDEKNRNRAL